MSGLLERLGVRNKLWTMVVLFVCAIAVGSFIDVINIRANLLAEKQLKTRHVVEVAHSTLEHFHKLAKAGTLSDEDARRQAKDTLRTMRYEKNEYFWINDLNDMMVMHPIKPELDGKKLDQLKDKNGKLLFLEFNRTAREKGGGFVDYVWPKPGSEDPVAKISYVKGFEPWSWVVGSGIYIDDVDQAVRDQAMKNTVLTAISAAVLVLLASLLAGSITRPLRATAAAMHDIASGEGDLTRRLPANGNNEIAELAGGFNQFSGKIEQALIQVTNSTLQINSASSRLSSVAEHTSENVRRQDVETEAVGHAVQGLISAVNEVNGHVEGAVNAAQQADSEAHTGKVVVESTIQAIHSVANEVSRAASVIQELENDSRNIGTILETIKGIADQTNLLALNAAIEAARAGEQGRGFAVVADEVRKLAQSTQEATARIQHMINSLQAKALEAVQVMEQGSLRVNTSVEQAGQAGYSLEKIAQAVSSIRDMNQQIAIAAASQSQVAQGINSNLEIMGQLAQETHNGVRDTNTAIGDLTKLLADLQGLVGQFKLGNR